MKINKIPPQNIEAEKAVLGSMIIDKEAINIACEILGPDDFYYESHKIIFNTILNLFNDDKPIDLLILEAELTNRNNIDKIGGKEYLVNLLDNISTTAHIEYYSNIIKEKSILRQLINSSLDTINKCYINEEPINKILDNAEQKIFNIYQKRTNSGFQKISDKLQENIEKIQTFFKEKKSSIGIRTGFTDFDNITSGLQPSNLIIIAARPAMGKTSFCLNIAENVALKEKKSVGIFSLEMSADELVFRILCSNAKINSHQVKTGFMSAKSWVPLTNSAQKLSEAKIFIDDTPALSIMEMKSKARRLKMKEGLDLIIIDYLQLMSGRSGKAEYRQQDISEITRGLKIMSKELNLPVIALSQLSRATDKRADQRPQLSDLRESGAIEQDADLVAFLYREGYYKPNIPELENKTELIIGKQRNGPIGTINLYFKGEWTRFENTIKSHYLNDKYT